MFLPFSCPVDGVWASWQSWQSCNVTCGGGQMQRHRTCAGPYFGGKHCDGSADDIDDCNTHECPGKYVIVMKSLLKVTSINAQSSRCTKQRTHLF